MIALEYGYAIDADENQYILVRSATAKRKGEEVEVWNSCGYYARLGEAVSAYCEKVAREKIHTTDTTLTEVIREYDRVYRKARTLAEVAE